MFGATFVLTIGGECKDPCVIQMFRTTTLLQGPGDAQPKVSRGPTDWEVDGSVPFGGTFTPPQDNLDSVAIEDNPNVEKFAIDHLPQPPFEGNTKQFFKDEFRSWLVCDGKVIGYVEWSNTIVFTYANKKVSAVESQVTGPEIKKADTDATQAGEVQKIADERCKKK